MTESASRGSLGAAELSRLLGEQGNVTLVDVRSPGEYAAMPIQGSVNLPVRVIEQHAVDIAARPGGDLVLVCAQGMRAGQAARVLTQAGVPEPQVLKGGLNAWQATGGEMQRGRGQWALERQVRPSAKRGAAAIAAGLVCSALSNTCTMARLLGLLPCNRNTRAFDLGSALNSLRQDNE